MFEYFVGNRVRGRISLVVECANVGHVLHYLPLFIHRVVELLRVQMLPKELNSRLSIRRIDLRENVFNVTKKDLKEEEEKTPLTDECHR